MTLAALLLLSASAWAGPLEVSGAPVQLAQLSLALEPRAADVSRFEAIEAISQIPGSADAAAPLPASAVPAQAFPGAAMPAPVAAALRSGDAAAFYQAVLDHDYTPPADDERQRALLDEGATRAEAEEKFEAAVAGRAGRETRRRSGAKIDYDAFGSALLRHPGLSSNIFQHAAAKRSILKAAGYTVLRGRGKTVVSIDDASDARVGEAFAHVLQQYRRP